MKKLIKFLKNFYHYLWALISAIVYLFPSRKVFMIGITGTKGKTSSVEIISAILEAAGKKTSTLSSLKVKIGDHSEKNLTGNSMPGRFFIQQFLSRSAKAGIDYAVIEVTSEGAVQHRHRFSKWKIAALTNLHPEHLESHGSLDNYKRAKLLFLDYARKEGAKIFLNQNDSGSEFFFQRIPSESVIFFSPSLIPELPASVYDVLGGDFNKDNIALAISVAEYLNIGREAIIKGLVNFKGVPGRLEYIQKTPFSVVVDYAHTPDSLEAVYQTVKPKAPGRLICVLGAAGGGRDKWKRPVFGKIASEYCDEIILTNEDPFDENPERILEEINAGLKGKKARKILDRKNAIYEAVKLAKPRDAVIITGKGSEAWIRVAHGKKLPWSERVAAEEALKKI